MRIIFMSCLICILQLLMPCFYQVATKFYQLESEDDIERGSLHTSINKNNQECNWDREKK